MIAPISSGAHGAVEARMKINIYAVGRMKNGPEKELAYQYMNFLFSAEVQDMMMRQFFTSPSNSKVVVPADLKADIPVSGADMEKILKWDWNFVNENQAALADRWAKTII